MTAHCAAKQTSATVATERPTATLDSQVSNRQIRCTSARGKNERNAQPNTKAALNSSMISMPGTRLVEPASWGCRNIKTPAAILPPMTSVSIAHHHDTGFDQAKDLGRAWNSD